MPYDFVSDLTGTYLPASVEVVLVKDKDLGPNVGGPKDISLLLGRRLVVAKNNYIVIRF